MIYRKTMDCFCCFFCGIYRNFTIFSMQYWKIANFCLWFNNCMEHQWEKKIATVQTITSRQKSTKHKLRAVFFTNRTCIVFVLFAGVAVNQCTFCIIIFTPVFFFCSSVSVLFGLFHCCLDSSHLFTYVNIYIVHYPTFTQAKLKQRKFYLTRR